eukprot:gnl/TRDRNA2_/TRDRNA2_82705_c0_seq1.p1 gnl/TRDRNA2_/TRDRNA2_82705_c0~~gnl/TRDRNA2_/TRDRNA2_82705_c0_seq1.p1  ORF type:complete len:489 (+),score=97.78 gnl/TRDRNA2_/TRDRNA2_82705_c0_seq1:107-1573(+)
MAEKFAELDASARLFITKVPHSVTRDDIVMHFGQFGDMTDVYMPQAPGSSSHKGMAFVSYKDANSMQAAINHANHEIQGQEVVVDVAAPRGAGKAGKGHQAPVQSSPPPYAGREFAAPSGFTDTADRLFITKVPSSVDQEGMKHYFAQFGELTDVYMPQSPGSVSHKGICFVSFRDPRSVQYAMSHNPHVVDGQQIVVDIAVPRAGEKGDKGAGKGGPPAGGHAPFVPQGGGPWANEEPVRRAEPYGGGYDQGPSFPQGGSAQEAAELAESIAVVLRHLPDEAPMAVRTYLGDWVLNLLPGGFGSAALVGHGAQGGGGYGAQGGGGYGAQGGGGYGAPPAPAGRAGTPVSGRLFLTKVAQEVSKMDLQMYFERYGELEDVYIPPGNKGIAFISYKDPSCVPTVLESRDHEVVPGKVVVVDQAVDRPSLDGKGKGGKDKGKGKDSWGGKNGWSGKDSWSGGGGGYGGGGGGYGGGGGGGSYAGSRWNPY